jgi:alanine transaminase
MEELERSYTEASAKGTTVRAIVVINPGNPTGSVLSVSNLRDVAKFAAERGMLVIADEVYQTNIWDRSKEFVSFKRVAVEMGLLDPARSEVARPGGLQLASLQSTSKGFVGECGRRGGYMEICGVDADVRGEMYKLASLNLCANTTGQLLIGLQCRPPVPGDPSWPVYHREREDILASLARRAVKLNAALRAMEGASCQPAEGAMYAFPQLRLPARAVAAARAAGKPADAFYALELLDAKGIVVVPGSGFGQRDGTFHFRATILPPERDMDSVAAQLLEFHQAFMDRYRD